MTERKNMETMIANENKEELTEVMDFMKELDSKNEEKFLAFLEAIRFVSSLNGKDSQQIA